MTTILSALGGRGVLAIAGWALAALCWTWLQLAESRAQTFEAQFARQAQRAANAVSQVKAGNAALDECAAINARASAALDRLSRQTAELRAAADQAERDASAARAREASMTADLEASEETFRARPDRPSASDQVRQLRNVLGRL